MESCFSFSEGGGGCVVQDNPTAVSTGRSFCKNRGYSAA